MCLVDIVCFLWISPEWFARIFHLWRTIPRVGPTQYAWGQCIVQTNIESMEIRKIETYTFRGFDMGFSLPDPPPPPHLHALLFRKRSQNSMCAVGVTNLVGWQFVINFVIRVMMFCTICVRSKKWLKLIRMLQSNGTFKNLCNWIQSGYITWFFYNKL